MSERPDGHLGDLLHGLIALLLRCLNAERAVVLALEDGRLQPVYPPDAPPDCVARALARSGGLFRSVGGEPLPTPGNTGPSWRFATHAMAAVQEIMTDTAELASQQSASGVRGQRATTLGQQPASALCLPIRAGGAIVGLLYLESGQAGDPFAPDLVARLLHETTPADHTGRPAERRISSGEAAATPVVHAPRPIVPLAELEREAILQALQIHRGNRTAAARALGISVRKLQYRIKEYARQGLPITSP